MAEKLVSMKMSRSEREEKYKPSEVSMDAPVYPYGLEVRLDNDALEKLGIELPEVGTEMLLIAKVKVTGASSNESENGKNRSVSLQITDMCLEDDAKAAKDYATKLYDGNAKES